MLKYFDNIMERQDKNIIPLAIIVAGGLIAAAIYFGGGSGGQTVSNRNNTVTPDVKVAPVTSSDHVLGPRSAPITIVEYSDTECPFCKVFHDTMHEVTRTYGDQVAWVYRHFPIASLHSKAPKEAEATECAAELGGNQGFWDYLDKLFATTNSNNSLDPLELPKIAGAVGLNVTAFNTCLSSGKYTEFITKSVEAAVKAGARGTPYSVIITRDGEQSVINGAEPLSSIKAKIDLLLK